MKRWYNIHNILKVSVEGKSRFARSLDSNLNFFRYTPIRDEIADIEFVSGSMPHLHQPYEIAGQYCYDGETLFSKISHSAIQVHEDGRYVIYSHPPPRSPARINAHIFIHLQLLKKDFTLCHAAGFSYDSKGVLLPAWGGVGKTSLTAILLAEAEWKLLGDDRVIVSKDGQVYSYPLPFVLYPYHIPVFPKFFAKKRRESIRMQLGEVLRPTFSHISLIDRLFLKVLYKNYVAATFDQIYPKTKLAEVAPLTKVISLIRCSTNGLRLEKELDKEQLIRNIIGVWLYEQVSSFSQDLFAMFSFHLIDFSKYLTNFKSILNSAFRKVDCYTIRASKATHFREVADMVQELILS